MNENKSLETIPEIKEERHCFDQRVKFRTGPAYEGKVEKKVYVSSHLALKGCSQGVQNSSSFY